MMNKTCTLAIIIPCYNEEEVIESTLNVLNQFLENLTKDLLINPESFLCIVDDGSKDRSWEKLKKARDKLKKLHLIKFTRNFGHQAALLAGLNYVKDKCDCAVTIDADLQDDHTVIREMIKKYNSGNEIVYGVRENRQKDSRFKKATANGFYKLMNALGAKTIGNHADFRLMNRNAIEYLSHYKEVNLFLRGIVPEIGLKTDIVFYIRKERTAGETKYPLKKMISFAIEGITSFSVKPLRIVTVLGLLIIVLSLIIALYIFISYLFGRIVQGWTSLIISIWFLGGVQLFSIGIIGEYIGKIYKETKRRPVYLIEKIYND